MRLEDEHSRKNWDSMLNYFTDIFYVNVYFNWNVSYFFSCRCFWLWKELSSGRSCQVSCGIVWEERVVCDSSSRTFKNIDIIHDKCSCWRNSKAVFSLFVLFFCQRLREMYRHIYFNAANGEFIFSNDAAAIAKMPLFRTFLECPLQN